MTHIIHRVGIKAPLHEVYNAIATIKGIAGWWSEDTTGTSEAGKMIIVRFHSPEGKELGSMSLEVQALDTGKKVHWKFTNGPQEWIGTDAAFDLKQEGEYTIIIFSHKNWREEMEFKAHCNMKWAIFMLSLKEYVEKGKGRPSPHDIKIDNWN